VCYVEKLEFLYVTYGSRVTTNKIFHRPHISNSILKYIDISRWNLKCVVNGKLYSS